MSYEIQMKKKYNFIEQKDALPVDDERIDRDSCHG